ncbi:uncharacterized protein L203_105994 [Cryptococcus depauperatus CBS 7841]|uniref:Major facilitator superfamily (MFS) profile domain-containing protein n=1 Tax=Cryptococcus depauperatus CBS 7841 TaxID=1295531 RepID=A0AAJ8M4L9_9TREE
MVQPKKVVLTVFFALVLDLLAFTIPLPLFPRLIEWYLLRESSKKPLVSRAVAFCGSLRTWLYSVQPISVSTASSLESIGGKNWDVVLLGGMMGSLFSLCQCLMSPWLGRLADQYGRRKVLLATMIGNILSATIWIQSTSFESYLLSRLIGGLSEGNVQLSTAIISDVASEATRSKSLALVGIAFSVCFTLGPSLGAYFATRPLPIATSENKLNIYAFPAAISLVLLLLETLYLAIRLPETKGFKNTKESQQGSTDAVENKSHDESKEQKLRKLKDITNLHGYFLLFFSGAEFTLTFLTYDVFSASNAFNGKLLSYIGVLAAIIQARHVRPTLAKIGEIRIALRGISSCTLGLILLSLLPYTTRWSFHILSHILLYTAATCLAYTSATTVTGLTAAAAGFCDERYPELQRGRALGKFRSRGQLGRAPIRHWAVCWLRYYSSLQEQAKSKNRERVYAYHLFYKQALVPPLQKDDKRGDGGACRVPTCPMPRS